MKVIKKYKSKKNEVYLAKDNEKYIIKKVFCNKSNYYKEKELYLNLSDFNKIPLLCSSRDNTHTILIEYLGEETVLSRLEYYENNELIDEAIDLLTNLINFIIEFTSHPFMKSNSYSLIDVNFRNFIIVNDKIKLIDLEDISHGSVINDIIKVIVMYLNYYPQYSIFKNTVVSQIKKHIIEKLCITDEHYNELYSNELSILQQRRNNRVSNGKRI